MESSKSAHSDLVCTQDMHNCARETDSLTETELLYFLHAHHGIEINNA